MMFNKILILDNDIIYPIISYKIDTYRNVNDPPNDRAKLYFQHSLILELKPNKVSIDFLFNLNRTNFQETTLVLFSEENVECCVLSKTFLKEMPSYIDTIIILFEVVRINFTNVSQVDRLKYIERDFKIKNILDKL